MYVGIRPKFKLNFHEVLRSEQVSYLNHHQHNLKGIFIDSNNILYAINQKMLTEKGNYQNLASFLFFVHKLRIIMCIDTAP